MNDYRKSKDNEKCLDVINNVKKELKELDKKLKELEKSQSKINLFINELNKSKED